MLILDINNNDKGQLYTHKSVLNTGYACISLLGFFYSISKEM
jgi:hypothetical protein